MRSVRLPPNCGQNIFRESGFTLLELIIVVVIVAVISAIAAPSLSTMIDNNRIRTEAQRIAGLIALARSHSITSNQEMILYGTLSDPELDIDLYEDGAGEEDTTVTYESTDGDIYVKRSTGPEAPFAYGTNTAFSGDKALRFDDKGRLNENAAAVITICNKSKTLGRRIDVNLVGRARVSTIDTPSDDCL